MTAPKPEPVKCKPGIICVRHQGYNCMCRCHVVERVAEPVSDPKLAEAVERLTKVAIFGDQEDYYMYDDLRILLDSWRQRGEECNDRNHVGLREFITGFRDVPAERGQDVALIAFKFERLKAELAEAIQTSGDLCDRCGWRGIRASKHCYFCETDRVAMERADKAEAELAALKGESK